MLELSDIHKESGMLARTKKSRGHTDLDGLGHCQSGQFPPVWESDIHTERAAAAELCGHCPALRPCRDYAAESTWAPGIVIAGWEATKRPQFPPWKGEPS